MAREGKKVMQFLDAGRYVAVVVDGKPTNGGGAQVVQARGQGSGSGRGVIKEA